VQDRRLHKKFLQVSSSCARPSSPAPQTEPLPKFHRPVPLIDRSRIATSLPILATTLTLVCRRSDQAAHLQVTEHQTCQARHYSARARIVCHACHVMRRIKTVMPRPMIGSPTSRPTETTPADATTPSET